VTLWLSIEGGRNPFIKEGAVIEGGGYLLTHKLDVVGRKNNKFS
jgi:hypothetical protein